MSTESTNRTRGEQAHGPDGGRLRVDLRIEADESFDCPLVETGESIEDARINAVGPTCAVDLFPEDGTVIRSSGIVSGGCLCSILRASGCVPHVRRIEGRTLFVTAFPEDRSAIRDLVAEIRTAVGSVALDRLVVVGGTDRTEQVAVDLSRLTAKQRAALELAVKRGYFDGEAGLEELAAELNISKSALSQRLRSGQAKLVGTIFDGT